MDEFSQSLHEQVTKRISLNVTSRSAEGEDMNAAEGATMRKGGNGEEVGEIEQEEAQENVAPEDEKEAEQYQGDEDDEKIVEAGRVADVEEEEDEGSPPDPVEVEELQVEKMPLYESQKAKQKEKPKKHTMHAFECDSEQFSWCKMVFHFSDKRSGGNNLTAVLHSVVKDTVVNQVPSIARAVVAMKNNGDANIAAEGENFEIMQANADILRLNQIYCNNIQKMSKTYGIEAAYSCIIKECQEVFGVYGITVDRRYFSLIADYMTQTGCVMGFNRASLNKMNSSPLQKMSFESAMSFLTNSAISGACDSLTSPSARQMVGCPSNMGTGACDLIVGSAGRLY